MLLILALPAVLVAGASVQEMAIQQMMTLWKQIAAVAAVMQEEPPVQSLGVEHQAALEGVAKEATGVVAMEVEAVAMEVALEEDVAVVAAMVELNKMYTDAD